MPIRDGGERGRRPIWSVNRPRQDTHIFYIAPSDLESLRIGNLIVSHKHYVTFTGIVRAW